MVRVVDGYFGDVIMEVSNGFYWKLKNHLDKVAVGSCIGGGSNVTDDYTVWYCVSISISVGSSETTYPLQVT